MQIRSKSGRTLHLPTPAEDAEIAAGIALDPDARELIDAELAKLQSVASAHSAVIFLDFDGVLHDISSARLEVIDGRPVVVGERPFRYLPLLIELLLRHPVQIVISSAWQDHCSIEELRGFLGDLGPRCIGSTGSLGAARGRGISRLAECEAVAQALGTSHWLIIDDQPGIVFGDSVPTREQFARVVFCDSSLGLSTPLTLNRIETWLEDAELNAIADARAGQHVTKVSLDEL